MALISILIIMGLAVWFHQTAERLGLPGVAWAIAGVIVYYGGFSLWLHGVLRGSMGGLFNSHGLGVAIAMDGSSILFGAACAALLRHKVLMRKGGKPADDLP
ncbi:hypothetical protein [Methylomagnum sp.]